MVLLNAVVILVVILVVFILLILFLYNLYKFNIDLSSPEERAGEKGEIFATDIIKRYLSADDLLFTNVKISYDDRRTELDNVIVNKYGVFIIEVKNYSGALVGEENDFEWKKYHISQAGNIYEKSVKNPIRQVKRQIHILAKYLAYYGIDVWVEGYVYFINNNNPFESNYVLSPSEEWFQKIHTSSRNHLTKKDINAIIALLS